jgi:SAM-dependent methyltransferase
MSGTPRILFANYAVSNCGVHQYGKNLFTALAESKKFRFEYADIRSLFDLDTVFSRGEFSAILVNYHPQTMPFVGVGAPSRYATPCFAIMHEMTQAEADNMPRGFFQYYVMGDPTLQERNSYVFSTGRIIREYENKIPLPKIPTIGSFGFSVGSKGFQRLVQMVQEDFEEAVIRINIPANGIIDKNAKLASSQIEECRRLLWRPGIRLDATHEFFSNDGLIDFLASNTLNAFLYDYVPVAGISSAADHAMMARRPIAITKSIMFRHLHDLVPPINVEAISLREIIQNDIRPYAHLLEKWAPSEILRRYEEILINVLARKDQAAQVKWGRLIPHDSGLNSLQMVKKMMTLALRIVRAIKRRVVQYVLQPIQFSAKVFWVNFLILLGIVKPRSRFNRILDDSARIEYAKVINRLAELVPGIFAKKIPRANIQQAFIFDAVIFHAKAFSAPRMLCIGSFEDSAAESLKKIGYSIEEIDPVVNKLDLNGFYDLPTTRKGTYDIIFSTSVLEHVNDDGKFVRQMAELLAPGGVGILTCDFKEGYKAGDPVINGDYRFYTKNDLSQRILGAAQDCELVDAPNWDCPSPDFDLGGFKYTFATLVFSKKKNLDFAVDFEKLSGAEQARFFNENGFLLVPAALTQDEVRQAIDNVTEFGLKGTTEEIWKAPISRQLVTNKKLLSALRAIFGRNIRFFKGVYVETPPDAGVVVEQRKALHVDYGIGEPQGDLRNSAASWVNVAFYMTDLTAEHSPLWVVPGSNRDYGVVPATNLEHLIKHSKMVLARAGDIVLFHSNTVHAASHNLSSETRHAFFYSYRPAWAKPAGPVAEWPSEFIFSFPPEHQELMKNLNVGL